MIETTRRKLSLPLALLLLTTLAAAQTPTRTAAPDVGRLRAHVTRLASDEMDGRRTGTPGAHVAAEFVAAEFERLGLRPVGAGVQPKAGAQARGLNKYFQGFPYVAAVELGKKNAMSFMPRAGDAPQNAHAAAAVDLRVGEDWTPLAWSASGRVERAGVVYVGYGIKAAELNHDDYAGVEVRDRIVLAFAGTPDGDNPHGRFARFADLRFKAAAAREQGARALIVVTRAENFKDDRLTRLRPGEGVAAGDAGLPVVLVSRQVARRAVEAAALPMVTFEKLEQAAGAQPAPAGAGAAGAAQGAPARANHSTPLKNIAFQIETDVVKREAPAYNVVGVLEGGDPRLKSEAIVIGAHYDHLGRGGSGSLAPREGEVHRGADDNASDTAALLELARLFTNAKERPRRTLVFAAFSGEEEGLLGSNFYVNKAPAFALHQTVAMLNMDMVGRMKDDKLVVGGVGTAAEWKGLIERANGPLRLGVTADGRAPSGNGVPVVTAANGQTVVSGEPRRPFALTLNEDGFGPSDHSSFYARQIPVLFFWTGTHEDYHKPTDTPERINYDGLARVTSLVHDMVRAVDSSDKRPTYALAKSSAAAGRSTGFRVYLGTLPSYAEGGEGLKLDGVRDDSPAAAAGLKAGDVIVRMAGRDVKNVYDYTYVLGEMKAGEEYEVEVLRGGERLKLKLTPAAARK